MLPFIWYTTTRTNILSEFNTVSPVWVPYFSNGSGKQSHDGGQVANKGLVADEVIGRLHSRNGAHLAHIILDWCNQMHQLVCCCLLQSLGCNMESIECNGLYDQRLIISGNIMQYLFNFLSSCCAAWCLAYSPKN